jgi:hypothetical protein
MMITAPERRLSAEALVAQAVAAGTADPGRAGERLLSAAGWDRKLLEEARSLLTRRLQDRSNDFEATPALRIVERALQGAPMADGPWRWQRQLSPRRIRATRRRARRRAPPSPGTRVQRWSQKPSQRPTIGSRV